MSKRGRVLVVDDLPQWREELVETLLNGNLYVEAAGSITHALEKLRKSVYHLLILDIRMDASDTSNVDGIGLLDELEKQGLNEEIKVVMLSAEETPEQVQQVLHEHYMIDFFSKDLFNSQAFLQAVYTIFKDELKINLDLPEQKDQTD